MADPRERFNDMEETMRSAVERELSTIWTALPVKVLEDSDGHIVKLQSTIKGSQQGDDGAVQSVNMPEFGMVPIHFPSGGGYTITHPIKKDDEGIVVFSSRCIDGWWKEGGLQPEPYHRQNHLSDAMYIPGIRNKPRKLNPYVSKDALQIRTDNQHYYVEISKDKVKLVFSQDKQGSQQADESQSKEEKEKTTTPIMVVEVSQDKIRGYVLNEQGQEQSYFEHTKDGQFKIKAPKQVFIDTPILKVTGKIISSGEITAKTGVSALTYSDTDVGVEQHAASDSISMSTHRHPQGNDSRGDREQDTGVPISGT